MRNEEKEQRTPKRGFRGGPNGQRKMASSEKAKDFKGAIKRLIQELSGFKVIIIVALILSILSSILSICT